jgi:hypothetical protein
MSLLKDLLWDGNNWSSRTREDNWRVEIYRTENEYDLYLDNPEGVCVAVWTDQDPLSAQCLWAELITEGYDGPEDAPHKRNQGGSEVASRATNLFGLVAARKDLDPTDVRYRKYWAELRHRIRVHGRHM